MNIAMLVNLIEIWFSELRVLTINLSNRLMYIDIYCKAMIDYSMIMILGN